MPMARYLRKSRSDDPHEDLQTTIERHKKLLSEYAAKHRLPVVETYEEVVTGDSIFARPEMMRLLADVEKGRFEAVLVVDMDRLGRGGQKDAGIILETFKYSGTKIITLDKTYDLNNDMDEELAEFKTFMSRREYKMINKRLQRGLSETIKDGGYIANAPYGYTKTTINKRPSLEINEAEAAYVRIMFDMYVHQGIGCSKISEEINRLGAKPHRAESFGRTSVQRIITNPVYAGKIVWNRTKFIRKGTRGSATTHREYQPRDTWVVVDGMHEAVVDEGTFNAAQEIYAGRYHTPSNTGEVRNPMSGLLLCERCGAKIQMQRCYKPYGDYSYLRCPTPGCSAGADSGLLESRMLEQLAGMLRDLRASAKNAKPPDVSSLTASLKAAARELQQSEKQKDKLYDLLEQGIYTAEMFTERSAAVNKKIASLREHVHTQEAAIARCSKNIAKEQAERLQNILALYGAATSSERNSMLKSIVERIQYRKSSGSSKMDFSILIDLKDSF